MRIGLLAERTQTPASTIRYYEKIGLIPFAERIGKRRNYGESIIWRINFISAAKATGFSLEEIQAFLELSDQTGQWREHVEAKISDLEARIKQYQTMKGALVHMLEDNCLDQGLEIFAEPAKQPRF